MRCPSCHSYIPEGLSDPVTCPQCGRAAVSPAQTPIEQPSPAQPEHSSAAPPPLPEPSSHSNEPFAPYFTIQATLAYGLANHRPEPGAGSLSFGPNGFSVVWDEGQHWEKILYRDLGPVRLVGDSVRITARDVESNLTLFHPWLPRWIVGPRRSRAVLLLELLDRVRGGLTPTEITTYQRELQ